MYKTVLRDEWDNEAELEVVPRISIAVLMGYVETFKNGEACDYTVVHEDDSPLTPQEQKQANYYTLAFSEIMESE